MTRDMRLRGRIEALAAGLCALLFLVTLIWPDWIEEVFGVDPDQHSGALEWAIVALALAAAVTFSLLARSEFRRARTLSAARQISR
ncbi:MULTISPECIES: ABC transporter permease [unclassified Streptomyces]|uniref:ABC transporter permease n=1 Tax=unclassified Streptomyces TaxID=2593676 RepID=UPI000FA9447B|nr:MULTISPECIES: ABC transporter permease [unclassified Streptomyces]MDH6455202.1 apolipoprotein N-acyltransferase [Streptomyces sp. SAI-119]MDH6494245.1 apolipoprotein N-acyltransferase [Streptomyces sp. SAI-149]